MEHRLFSRVAHLAAPLHVVDAVFKVGDAHAEVAELCGELGCEAIDQCLLLCIGLIFLRHRLGDHLRHLIARDLILAAIRAVAIALDDAFISKLSHGIVCPMIPRHISKGIRRRKGGNCRAGKRRSKRCRQKLLVHE